MTSAASRRVAKLEGALPPRDAVLHWLAEAQQFPSLVDHVRAIAAPPVEAAPLQFQTAMATLTAGSLGTYVYVVSIPDAYQLWNLFKGNFWARFTWSIGGVCQSVIDARIDPDVDWRTALDTATL